MRLRSSVNVGVAPDRTPDTSADSERLAKALSLSPDAIRQIGQHQATEGRSFEDVVVELGFASEADVRRAIAEQQGFAVLPQDDDRIDQLVIAAFDPNDPLSVLARDIRGTLTQAVRNDGSALQTVAVIGVGEGMTESALFIASLAVACAQAGHRTLLVDARIGSPSQHGLFRASNRVGLSGALAARGRTEGFIQPSAIPGLSILPAGPDVPNAPELLERQRLAVLLDDLRDAFDLLLVDAGAAATMQLSASSGLDGVILVARRNATETSALRGAVQALQAQGTAVLGSVLIS